MNFLAGFFYKYRIAITLISTVVVILILPLIMIYALSFFITTNSNFSDKDLKGNISTPTIKVKKPSSNKTSPPSQVIANGKTVENNSSIVPEDETDEQENENPVTPQNTPETPPPIIPTQDEIEFIGTVTSVSGNVITFNYGTSQSVDVKVTGDQLSSLSLGARAHVHAELENGSYVAQEIEIL